MSTYTREFSSKVDIAILGAGFAGISAARTMLEQNVIPSSICVFEADDNIGGIAGSYTINGFTFDYGIHGLYTKNDDILKLLSTSIHNQHDRLKLSVVDYYRGYWTRHPSQLNLYPYPTLLIENCLTDFLEVKINKSSEVVTNYKDWCLQNLGQSFSTVFQFPYTKKFWTVEPEELTVDWMGPRVHAPNVHEIIRGALFKDPPNLHYVTEVFYPRRGGFQAYINSLAQNVPILVKKTACHIEVDRKLIRFSDGTSVEYQYLISSIPIPSLVEIIADVPYAILSASKQLQHTSVALVNLGVNRRNILKHHWTYVYDADIPFSRISSPSLWAETNSPHNTSSLQAEIYYRDEVPNINLLRETTIKNLKRMNIIDEEDDILVSEVCMKKYANVIYNHFRIHNLNDIHSFLREKDIFYCGRYGKWNYDLVDQVMDEAQKTANEVLYRIST